CAPLADTASGARDIGELFTAAHPDGEALVRVDSEASKAELFASAPSARFVHLATHGYFAPDWAPRDAAELSPLAVCGFARAGANRPADALGHCAGIVTGEELAQLDLSRCELVVLSAYDASRDAQRAADDHASVCAALLAAGARCVLVPAWRTDDAA